MATLQDFVDSASAGFEAVAAQRNEDIPPLVAGVANSLTRTGSNLTSNDAADLRDNLDVVQKTGVVVAKGFTLNDGTMAARSANNAILQAAIDSIGTGSSGTVIIGVQDGQDDAELWFNDTGRVDQGGRSITLQYPPVLTIKGSTPVVNRIITLIGRATYSFSSSQFPLNAGTLNRPPLVNGATEPLLEMVSDVFAPQAGHTIARRHDFISTRNDYEGLYGNSTRTSRVYGSSENFAFWDRWTLMTTPVAHDSGTPDASPSPVNGALVLHEMNILNLTRDAGNVVSAAVSPFTAGGLSVVPECEDFQGRGFRRGYNMSWSYYCGPSPVPDVDGRHAKTVNPFWIDPNAVAPQGRAFSAGGNDRADPGLIALHGGRGGINSPDADPDAVINAFLYWKTGINFTKAVFQNGTAAKLGPLQNVTIEHDGLDRKVFGEYSDGTVAIAPTGLGNDILLTGQNFGPTAFAVKTSYTIRNCWGFVRPEMNEVVWGGEGTTNIHQRISPSGTGAVILTGLSGRVYATNADAAAGGIPVDGLYIDAMNNVRVRVP